MSKEVRLYTIKENYRLGDDIQSKVLAFAFSLSAEIERQLISQRTKEGLARLKAQGVKLGRKPGSHIENYKLKGKEEKIQSMLEKGYSKSKICRKLHVSRGTLYKELERMK